MHFLGICGYAVSGAALMAKQLGWTVTGSDEDVYPPTTDILTAAGIPWTNTHDPANLDRNGSPDLVVVGNQVREGNPEWAAAVARGLPITSEAEFYGELTRDRFRIAVCGTHGKTTTASLLAWMLERAGMAPGFRLGTTSRDFGTSARLGEGVPFVIEGDEYTTAPWDPRPKFLHAHPEIACVTRLELDHPDVYASFEAYRAPFVELAASMLEDGLLVLCADDPECVALAAHASCPTVTYGTAESAEVRVSPADAPQAAGGTPHQRFTVTLEDGSRHRIELTSPGEHNRLNATAALLLAVRAGADLDRCIAACADFRGASRRFEMAGAAGGVTVIDDYAHHPTEVAATVRAARERTAGRVLALYVPHTFSRTLTLLDDYDHAFDGAALVLVGPIEPARERHLSHTVSSADVVAHIAASVGEARTVADAQTAATTLAQATAPGDLVLCMSVRGFDSVARRTVEALEARFGAG